MSTQQLSNEYSLSLKLRTQFWINAMSVAFLLSLSTAGSYYYMIAKHAMQPNTIYWLIESIRLKFFISIGKYPEITRDTYRAIEYSRSDFISNNMITFAVAGVTFVFVIFLANLYAKKLSRNKSKSSIKRGSVLIKASDLIKSLKKSKESSFMRIGGIQEDCFIVDADKALQKKEKSKETDYRKSIIEFPVKAESKHFFVVGRSGTGKTTLIKQMIRDIRKRSNKAMIHDFKGDYTKAYAIGGDLVFNPAEPSICARWSVFNDIGNDTDITNIANILVGDPKEQEDPFWKNSAKSVIEGGLRYLYDNNQVSNLDIWNFFNRSTSDIEKSIRESRSPFLAKSLENPKEKTALSVISVVSDSMRVFELLSKIDGEFSIREWISDEKDSFIFLQNMANVQDAVSPALSLFIDFASKIMLAQDEIEHIDDSKNNTWMIFDEIGMLNKQTSIIKLLTQGRSKGVKVIIGIQTATQLDMIYGKNHRKEIINNCSNYAIFHTNEEENAEMLSRLIGDAQVVKEDKSISHKIDKSSEDINIRQSEQRDRAVYAAELQALSEREFYFKIEGQKWTSLKVYPQKTT